MSYDLYFQTPPCAVCGERDEGPDSMSPTYNVGGIFRACLGPGGIKELAGMHGETLAARANAGLAWLEDHANAEQLAGLQPSNGWGSTDSVTSTLQWVRRVATSSPLYVFDPDYGANITPPALWAVHRCEQHTETPIPEPSHAVTLARALLHVRWGRDGECNGCESWDDRHRDGCAVVLAEDILAGRR